MSFLVKICGMTRREDAETCARLGADFLGFIFHPASPRNVTPEFAAEVRIPGVKKVGVFVKQSAQEVLDIMKRGGLDMAQLHGGQEPDFCRKIGPERVLRAFWPERYESQEALAGEMARFADAAAFFLLDAGASGGGHGRSMNFSRIENLESPRPFLLAGGLGPHNLDQVVALAGPAGVDLNSGLESAPGIKEPEAVKKAFRILEKRRAS